MAADRTYDRIRSFGGGVDGYRPPSEIAPDQSALMENCIIRDNYEVRTRPGADQIDSKPTSFTNVNPRGPVQGLFFYDAPVPGSRLMLAQGQKLYNWNGATWSNPMAMPIALAPNAQIAFEQGVDKLFLSDGVGNPQIWDGNVFTDSGGPGQLNAPVGCTILCFSAGRMLASGVAAYPDTIFASNLLNFGPGAWNSATQSFRIGDGDGEAIMALAPMQNFLVAVLKENSVWLLDMDPSIPIAQWQAQPQGDLVGAGVGCVGKRAWCLYQNDVLFMSQDGVQSLQRMQAAAGQYQLTAPLSLPIQPYIDRINWSVAYLIKAVKYRHLAIFFVPLDNSVSNNYALVWNGRLGQWMGAWTGWTGEDACVTRFSKVIQLVIGGFDGSVNLWKDAPSLLTNNSTYTDNGVAVPTTLYTRSFIFGNFDVDKQLDFALFRFNGGSSEVTLTATLDLSDDDTWTGNVEPSGDILPALLPFKLASFKPVESYRSLEGLEYCNEVYFKLTSTQGWWALRNVLAGAFPQTIRDPAA